MHYDRCIMLHEKVQNVFFSIVASALAWTVTQTCMGVQQFKKTENGASKRPKIIVWNPFYLMVIPLFFKVETLHKNILAIGCTSLLVLPRENPEG